MKLRRGQVALYLVLALLGVVVLLLMNVNVFLAVRAKNRLMNAADAAAIAAAKVQGALLNELARMNVAHLQSLIDGERWDRELEMRELAMFRPLEAIAAANQAAASWGFEGAADGESLAVFRDHLSEIRAEYANNPQLYPEYRDGQWLEYADRLGGALGANAIVVPGFMEIPSAWRQEPLLSGSFYDAIAGRAWCWFRLGGRSRYLNYAHDAMPRPEALEPAVQENSEVFSLHVTFASWPDSLTWPGATWTDFDEDWIAFVAQIADRSVDSVKAAVERITDPAERWAFYDDYWGQWSRVFNPDEFPIAGEVRPEYDVAGCVASVRIQGSIPRLLDSDETATRAIEVTAEAKPLGTVEREGATCPVTVFNRLIAPSDTGDSRVFREAQLVPMESVPRSPGYSTSPQWYHHVREHLPDYLATGPKTGSCYYCTQLSWWEGAANRDSVRTWLGQHGDSCSGDTPGDRSGGHRYGH